MKFIKKIRKKLQFLLYYFQIKKFPFKSKEAFMILKEIIYLVSPEILVEFGSGKSTIHLSEYCHNKSKELISIESNFLYYLKTKNELRKLSYNKQFINYVPIKNGWYEINFLNRIKNIKRAELIFIDGPCSTKNNARNTFVGNEFIRTISQNCKLMIIDDIDRDEVRASSKYILEKIKNDFYYFLIENNVILIAIKKDIFDKVKTMLESLELEKDFYSFESISKLEYFF